VNQQRAADGNNRGERNSWLATDDDTSLARHFILELVEVEMRRRGHDPKHGFINGKIGVAGCEVIGKIEGRKCVGECRGEAIRGEGLRGFH